MRSNNFYTSMVMWATMCHVVIVFDVVLVMVVFGTMRYVSAEFKHVMQKWEDEKYHFN